VRAKPEIVKGLVDIVLDRMVGTPQMAMAARSGR
jgi:hypothetical protein